MKNFYLSSIFLFSFSIISGQELTPPSPGDVTIYHDCPINSTQEEFANAINPLICDAIYDFESVTGEETSDSGTYRIFEVKNMSFPGAQDMYLTLLPREENDIMGKDLILMFQCEGGLSETDAQHYFDNISAAIEALEPPCTELDLLITFTDLDVNFLKSTTWEGDVSSDDWDGYVDVELDLKIIDATYWIILHIFMPDDY